MAGRPRIFQNLSEFGTTGNPSRRARHRLVMPVVLLGLVAGMAGLMSSGFAAAAPASAGQVTLFAARVILNPEWITAGPDGGYGSRASRTTRSAGSPPQGR
jgi:hypothetical protein